MYGDDPIFDDDADEPACGKINGYTVLVFDPSPYIAYLDDPALSDEQKREILQTVWEVLVAFVDLGFGIHPVQQAVGSDPLNDKDLQPANGVVLGWLHSLSHPNDTMSDDAVSDRAAAESDS